MNTTSSQRWCNSTDDVTAPLSHKRYHSNSFDPCKCRTKRAILGILDKNWLRGWRLSWNAWFWNFAVQLPTILKWISAKSEFVCNITATFCRYMQTNTLKMTCYCSEQLHTCSCEWFLSKTTCFTDLFVDIERESSESRKHVRHLRRLTVEWQVAMVANDVTVQIYVIIEKFENYIGTTLT